MAKKRSWAGVVCGLMMVGSSWAQAREIPEPKPARQHAEKLLALELRARELASTSREEVLADVRSRARALGVRGSYHELVESFHERAWRRLELERCELESGEAPGACRAPRAALDELETRFSKAYGLTMAEFKGGYRRPPLDAGLSGGGSTRTDPQYCSCDFTISSKDRSITGKWALECNNHGGHGVCSTNVDSAHSPGAGAMTGDIDLFFGNEIRSKDCDDDHRTCFRGPAPSSKPGGGAWTNVCNCDTLHSQWSDPNQTFFGGDLFDSTLVLQASFNDVVADGPCTGKSFTVHEFIKENDPWCCDDPMGTLVVWNGVADGTNTYDLPASATNCNGGSQSGLPPDCGTFGATIRVTASCQTLNDETFGSCSGRCGEVLPDATCNCDFDCQQEGDCCFDYCDSCASQYEPPIPCNEF